MKIDFDGIQAFVAVGETGSFVRAARLLNVTQTALTRRVQKLEAYLGLKLLDRTTRRVELTPVGRDFLPQAREIVGGMTSAVARLKDISQRSRGNVTLACIQSTTLHLLPQVIRDYSRSHPDNRIRLLDGSSHEVRSAVLNGQAEIGVALRGERHADLLETPLLDDPLAFICPVGHRLAGRKSIGWSDLRNVDLVTVASSLATRVAMEYQLIKRGIQLQGAFEVQHHATAINLVAAGVGCAVLPASTFREGDRPGVRRIPLVRPIVSRKLVLLRQRQATLSPAAEAFWHLLRKSQ